MPTFGATMWANLLILSSQIGRELPETLMLTDFLYPNAPLVEVIAEVHWKLEPIQSIPNAAIDPHYKAFNDDFEAVSAEKGFTTVERTIPDEVPRELLGHQITRRYRKEPSVWPLYQTGPGVLAMNIVPPYNGWAEFAPFVREGVDLLWLSYPIPDRYLKIEKLHLRYIDAFTSAHGLEDRAQFVRADLGMAPELPPRILAHAAAKREPIQQSGDVTVSLLRPADSKGQIKVETGKSSNEPAVIATFVVETTVNAPQDRNSIHQWFDDAHYVAHDLFDSVISDRVRERLGPKESIK